MNVSLTPELEKWVKTKVSSGLYQSASEVVREALRALQEQEQLKEIKREELRNLLRSGVADLDEGNSIPLTQDLIASLKAKGRKKLKGDNG